MSARVARAHEVVVVGGGQAGLEMGRQLARQGRDFTILEASKAPAAARRERWELAGALHARPLQLAARPAVPGDADAHLGRDDVVAYLTEYARHFELPWSRPAPCVACERPKAGGSSSSTTPRTRPSRSRP
jgi:putative flavoprotein involved in K+ transport